ncbi:MAG TPA: hypothetical protein VFR94_25555 [Nitrososphaeraceae archaeon]|nr:hypothetical protein [Nitrososphaeraceae archaeon]
MVLKQISLLDSEVLFQYSRNGSKLPVGFEASVRIPFCWASLDHYDWRYKIILAATMVNALSSGSTTLFARILFVLQCFRLTPVLLV